MYMQVEVGIGDIQYFIETGLTIVFHMFLLYLYVILFSGALWMELTKMTTAYVNFVCFGSGDESIRDKR